MIYKACPLLRSMGVVPVLTLAFVCVGDGVVQAADPKEAPAAFDNRTNGFIKEQENFEDDKDAFDETEEVFPKDEVTRECIDPVTWKQETVVLKEEVRGGLGPVYNSTSCVACHQNAGFVSKNPADNGLFTSRNPPMNGSDALSGISSQVSEIRAGHQQFFPNCVEPNREQQKEQSLFLFVEAPGSSLIQQRAVDPRFQETVPEQEKIRTLRMATSTLGDGFVEFIADATILDIQKRQEPDLRGTIVFVPVAVDILTVADGKPVDFKFKSRVGRFGWKCQEASLLNFSAGAYLAEMGITNPLQPKENTSLGRDVSNFDPVNDPEDPADLKQNPPVRFGQDVEAFARFMRATKAPPRAQTTLTPDAGNHVSQGEKKFIAIGCTKCHVQTLRTVEKFEDLKDLTDIGTQADPKVDPKALVNKIIHPFSDFMLHDIGTGDGIVQTQFSDRPPAGLDPVRLGGAAVPPAAGGAEKTFVQVAPATPLRNEAPERAERRKAAERLNNLLRGGADLKAEGPRSSQAEQLRRQDETGRAPEAAAVQVVAFDDTAMVFTLPTANMIRTAPLWGLRTRPQLLHDGSALTLRDAIAAHRGQADRIRRAFEELPLAQQEDVLEFLRSL